MKIEKIEPGSTYHIYNRGNNSQDVFFKERNYRFFINQISEYLPSIAYIYAYCLMRNHYHLVLRIKDKVEIPERHQSNPSQVISNMLNSYVKVINLTRERTGSLFEKTFERKRITTEDYLRKAILYVHRNPAKHKVTPNFLEYPFSSVGHYKRGSSYCINTGFVFDLFGGEENFWYMHNLEQSDNDLSKDLDFD
jgi:REP element-mobilizing transposase RayT